MPLKRKIPLQSENYLFITLVFLNWVYETNEEGELSNIHVL